ncbi:hypothetical protein LSH36_512g02038 [Paralvinella palmiformis]|uniref:Guanylate cyclase domain-containing protein n=1 Tax=Paralvinella palmiformis TaxID=53620 RepID=A0AAD9MY94_9ANNE|nr:hypothetical protein LSH36_512g02038 [Paralvinella palmiformis]
MKLNDRVREKESHLVLDMRDATTVFVTCKGLNDNLIADVLISFRQIREEAMSRNKISIAANGKNEGTEFGMIPAMEGSCEEELEKREMIALVDRVLDKERRRGGCRSRWQIVLFFVPLFGLIVLSTIALVQIFNGINQAQLAATSVSDFVQLDDLVDSLQLERGTSAIYLSSNGTNVVSLYRMWEIQKVTDARLRTLANWPEQFVLGSDPIHDKDDFRAALDRLRDSVRNVSVDFRDGIRLYTAVTNELMKAASYEVKIPGKLWTLLVAALATLRASDAMGIQRAIGSAFFSLCGLDRATYRWFVKMDCEVVSQQRMAFLFHSGVETMWRRVLSGELYANIVGMKSDLYNASSYRSACEATDARSKSDNALVWFNDMTSYMDTWKVTRTTLIDEIKVSLSGDLYGEVKVSAFYAALIAIVFITCTTMFPDMITRQLREDLASRPQRYCECVTLYFSDIVAFDRICADSNPQQIVMLLSKMYCNLDAAINRYDVYKVESSHDKYMVVSGRKAKARIKKEIDVETQDLHHIEFYSLNTVAAAFKVANS